MKNIFFSILLILSFSACGENKSQQFAAMDCYVRYMAPEGKSHAEATLQSGDSPAGMKPVEVAGGIKYQDADMDVRPVEGITYVTNQSRGFEQQHTFSWKGADEKPLSVTGRLSPLLDFGFPSSTLPRSAPARFQWSGAPLEKGEVLVFLWEKTDERLTVPMEVFGEGLSYIDFPAVKLSSLSPGLWTYYVVRKKLTRSEVKEVKVNFVMEYYTSADTVKIL